MQIARVRSPGGGARLALTVDGRVVGSVPGDASLAELLRLPASAFRARVEAAQRVRDGGHAADVLAPIDGQTEVWAAGVTYRRSEQARVEESATPDIYTRVYRAERPELFFKATARRVAGPDEPIVVRSDSTVHRHRAGAGQPFTLGAGDVVEIEIDSLGMLRNPVVRGKAGLAA